MNRSFMTAALALAFGLSLPAFTYAQAAPPPAQEQKQEKKEPEKAPEVKRDSKSEAYDKAVKELTRLDGDMVIYQRKKEILLELPEEKLGKIFLVQATLNSGLDSALMHAGMPVGDTAIDAFRFERNEDQVWLVRPNLTYRWDKGDAFAVGAERSFQEAILSSFKIEQQDPEKKRLLVNITRLFYGDVFRLSEMVTQGLSGQYGLDSEKSGVEKAKAFPENTVVQMKLHYFSPRGAQVNPFMVLFGLSSENTLGDDRSAPLKVTYSMWYRKDTGYKPRVADPRIGYFDETFFSVDKYLNVDRTERLINRFHLVKKDPTAALSEPVKPIVWTIDPSIPPTYRDAVKQGVLRWNKGFEAIGFKNAVQVQDVPKDPDYDHADGRYNVIRMMVSPSSLFGAISLFRTDPYSGQILNSSITLDGNIVRDLQQEHLRNSQSARSGGVQRALEVLHRNDDRHEQDDQFLFATPEERSKQELAKRMSAFGWGKAMCTHATDLTDQSTMAWAAVQAAGPQISKEDYVKKFLADCVSHEMGHCLGLRHNFAASANLTTAQLADDALTSEVGISASVMDYNPPNVQAVLRGTGNFYAPTIGPYDKWAIAYGYSTFPNVSTGEKFQLAQIAGQSGKPGHAFMTDENADTWNPYAVRFDGAKDPLVFSEKSLVALKRARDYAIKNLPRRGESYSKRTNVVISSIMKSFREARTAARFVGGVDASRNFRGDSNEKPTLMPIDASLQRQAVALIAKNFLSKTSFDLPEDVLTTLSVDENQPSWNAPLRDVIGTNQASVIGLLLGAGTTYRISENSYKVKNGYGLDEHFDMVTKAVFAEVGASNSVKPLRRDLQRFAINAFMTIAGGPTGAVNEDARVLASQNLKSLQNRMQLQLKTSAKLDNMTRLHLKDSSESIARFMARGVTGSR